MAEKLIELCKDIYYIPNSTNAGIITVHKDSKETLVYIIDSGPSEIEGEYIIEVLDEYFKDYTVKALITTHGHPDHTGGHRFIKESTACEIWISEKEKAFLENPSLHGNVLWGAYPPKELRSLYFRPEPARADRIIGENDYISLEDGRKLSFVEFCGHSPESIGITAESSDGKRVLFAGDAIFPRKELSQHWISLITNPVMYMNTLDKIEEMAEDLDFCIAGHGEMISDDLKETIEINKIAILSTRQCILNLLKKNKKMSLESLVKAIADYHSLSMKIPLYALITSTIKSYLDELQDERKVQLQVEDNVLYYSLK